MQHRLNSIIYKVAALLAVLGLIGFVGQLLMLRAIYMRKTKRMTWTMRLININSMFALSYLIILTPIGKAENILQTFQRLKRTYRGIIGHLSAVYQT